MVTSPFALLGSSDEPQLARLRLTTQAAVAAASIRVDVRQPSVSFEVFMGAPCRMRLVALRSACTWTEGRAAPHKHAWVALQAVSDRNQERHSPVSRSSHCRPSFWSD